MISPSVSSYYGAPVCVKSATETFDDKGSYAIREGKIFFQPFSAYRWDPWKEIPFPYQATQIHADRDSLVVVDESKCIHFTKTTSKVLEWKRSWFKTPLHILSRIINVFNPPHLYAMEEARSVAVAQGEKKKIYMLSPSGTRIFFATSNALNKFSNEITGPEEGTFAAESMDVSGSKIFLFRRFKDAVGTETQKMYVRDLRKGAVQDWEEQTPIFLSGQARVTKQVAIQGSELRVEGTDELGRSGYYVKRISDDSWSFQTTGHFIYYKDFSIDPNHPKQPDVVQDYTGSIVVNGKTIPAVLKKFSERGLSERGLHTTLDVELPNGEKYSCPLRAKTGLKHRFGKSHGLPYWSLEGFQKKAFENVKVQETSKAIIVEGKGFKASFPRKTNKIVSSRVPPPLVRGCLKVLLVFLRTIKIAVKMTGRLIDKVFLGDDLLKARDQLIHSLQLDEYDDTAKLLRRMTAKDPNLAPKELVDFFCDPNVRPHIKEILSGANVCLEDPSRKWEKVFYSFKEAKERVSSHPYKEGTSFGLETPLFRELLFWIDKHDGKLRFQFEGHALRSIYFKKLFYKFIGHTIDYFEYKHSGEQQGGYGSSPHTDDQPLVIMPFANGISPQL